MDFTNGEFSWRKGEICSSEQKEARKQKDAFQRLKQFCNRWMSDIKRLSNEQALEDLFSLKEACLVLLPIVPIRTVSLTNTSALCIAYMKAREKDYRSACKNLVDMIYLNQTVTGIDKLVLIQIISFMEEVEHEIS